MKFSFRRSLIFTAVLVVVLVVAAWVLLLSDVPADALEARLNSSVELPSSPPVEAHGTRIPLFDNPQPPEEFAAHTNEAAVLVDVETGRQLYSKNAGAIHPAASLTKVVTMYAVLDEIATGAISTEQRLSPDPRAFWQEMPAGSSLLFLGPGQEVSWDDLLAGLAVASGNDAAHAVAYELAGGTDAFSRRMNELVREAGVSGQHFEEPSGIAPGNRITAEGFADFIVHYMRRFPDAVERYHELEEFVFSPTQSSGSVRHENRNRLLGEYEGADGLKTGYIRSSGYNIAATAKRGGRRIVAVVLGVSGETHYEGGKRRAEEAADILDYGFDGFTAARLAPAGIRELPVVGGERASVGLEFEGIPVLLGPAESAGAPPPASESGSRPAEGMPAESADAPPPASENGSRPAEGMEVRLIVPEEIRAPVGTGDVVGYVSIVDDGKQVAWQPVLAAESVARGQGVLQRYSYLHALIRGVPSPVQLE